MECVSTKENASVSAMNNDKYVLVGYFRFIESDKNGVTGEVVSKYTPHWADDSDVPVYRKLGETKATLDEN